MCPLTASDDLLRILSVQTLSTKDHASPSLRASIHTETAAAGAGLLREGIARRKQMLSEMSDAGSEPEKQEVEREIEQLTTWLSEYDASGYKAKTEWSICYTQIVARKAFWMGKDEDWETEATWG